MMGMAAIMQMTWDWNVMNTEQVKAWLMVHANGTELITQEEKDEKAVAQLAFWKVYPLKPLEGTNAVKVGIVCTG